MHFLNYFHFKTIKYDLINKFHYNKTKNIPKLKKIILHFSCKDAKLKNITSSLLALEIITNKAGDLTRTKQPNILLKIRKGNPVGCKVVLRNKQIFDFLERFISEILPKIKNINKTKISSDTNRTSFCFEINDTLNFKELENNYYIFSELGKLDLTVIFDSSLELNFNIASLKLTN